MDSIKVALFDLDGTLVETHLDFPAMRRAMEEMAIAEGMDRKQGAGGDILGIVETACLWIERQGGDPAAYRRRAYACLEEMEVAGCAHPAPLAGSREWLAVLSTEGIKIAIVTRNCRRVATGLLAQFSLPHDLLLARDDVRFVKPDPRHLLVAVAELGHEAQEAIMVGDHWMDIQAGKAAGVACSIGVLGQRSADWFAPCPPDYVVRDLEEASGLAIAQRDRP